MAQTPSTMLPLGTRAPEFSLPEPSSGKTISLSEFTGKHLLVIFSCNHCPYVIHILESLTAFANELALNRMPVVMISANDIDGYPADGPAKMIELSRQYGFAFPYLYDESQQVAQSYAAACTPDFFLFDADHELVYRGQYDASRPGNDLPVDGKDLKRAVDAMLSGELVPDVQIPSVGCNIKWKSGNAPDYF
ncbi:MAG: thioredoxin family protein [Pseudomonadota bacterium]